MSDRLPYGADEPEWVHDEPPTDNARLIEEARTTHESLDLTLRLASALEAAEATTKRLEQVGWVEPTTGILRRNYPTVGWEPVYRLHREHQKNKTDNKWHHVEVVQSGTSVSHYVDGQEDKKDRADRDAEKFFGVFK